MQPAAHEARKGEYRDGLEKLAAGCEKFLPVAYQNRSTFISQSSPHFQLTLEVQLTSGKVREQSDCQVTCVFGHHLTVTFQYSKVTKQTEVTVK